MEDRVYWIWLSLAVTPATDSFAKLISRFSDPRSIYEAEDEDIAACIGSRSRDYNSLVDKSLDKAEEVLEFCTRRSVGILVYSDENFPSSLRQIPTPPVLLYYRGKLPDFNSQFFASVVGTRRLSDYGRRNAFRISHDLSLSGAIIVSGMAIGIDGVAHAGAIAAGGRTVAVIGSGIDVCYPKQHLKLAREIVKCGCVITEYAPGTKPERVNFPARNRIISGLSELTLVVEGKEKSGALLTARHAKEQGRALYALPGNVGNPTSELTNLLLKNGARVCTSADDIIRDFESSSHGRLNPFLLADAQNADMASWLSELSVSAVAPSDPIFKPSRKAKAKAVEADEQTEAKEEKNEQKAKSEPSFDKLDESLLKIYKRIPEGGECLIESLVDEELSLRTVMKGLLKLEIGRFITMLPGEKVKRK